jgi:tetratricopeptide (TPR) repeat protein
MKNPPPNYGARNPSIAVQGFQLNVATKPPFAVSMYQKAVDFKRAGRLLEAEQALRAVLTDDSGHADTLHLLGIVRHQLGDSQEAEILICRAIAVRADIHFIDNLGNLLWESNQLDKAQVCYRKALTVDPGYVNAYVNLGTLLKKCERYEEAETHFRRALTLQSHRADALCSLGYLLYRSQCVPEAMKLYRQALIVQPDYIDAYLNLGAALRDLHRVHEALKCCEHALAIMPERAEARLNHAILLLQLGRFKEGWREYEYRWQLDDVEKMRAEMLWLGKEDLHGKSILLHAEQGHGDTLQFVRYASMVVARGARVYLLAQSSLKSLLESCDGVQQVFAHGEDLPSFDFQCPMMSLPMAFGTELDSIPANIPYLAARADKVILWQQRFGARAAPRVGLVWAGEARQHDDGAHALDRQRSLHFDQLRSLLNIPGVQFYSLQIANAAREQIAGDRRIIDFSTEIEHFEDTAALIQNLDLVITVDTSVAHLAGAVGRQVWLLDRYSPCWRWLTDRDDSPWYPQMRIFRQASPGDWGGVILRVQQALTAVANRGAV